MYSQSSPPEQQSLPLSTSSYAYRKAHQNTNHRHFVELSGNDRQYENVMDTDAFYRPRHLENTRPIVHEVSNRGQSSSSSSSSSSRPIQKKKRAPKRRIDEFVNDPRYREFYSIESMDTQQVSQSLFFKINQLKLSQIGIAEKVLERSQGTLSDLLSKPKEWKDLRSGHDTYRRMYMFLKLSDQEMKRIMVLSTDEVQQMMNFPPTTKVQKNKNDRDERPKEKRARTVFDAVQKQTLEAVYQETSRPNHEIMVSISQHLDLTLETVTNWFMNRRGRDTYSSI